MKRWVVALSGMVVVVALGALAANGAEEKVPAGKTLFLDAKCNSCHSVEAAGIERKASADADEADAKDAKEPKKKTVDLSSTGLTTKAEWLPKYLKKLETTKEGKKHVKSWKGTDEDLATLCAWLMEQKAPVKEAKDEGAKK